MATGMNVNTFASKSHDNPTKLGPRARRVSKSVVWATSQSGDLHATRMALVGMHQAGG
jgi:hypothetical protein